MNEIDIIRDISQRFEQARILYMLTGSMAMNYYAQPRMTRDIDVVIAIALDDVDRVAALFRPDYLVSEENIRESVAHESIFNLIHQESVIKVDCIICKSSQYRKTEFERRQKISSSPSYPGRKILTPRYNSAMCEICSLPAMTRNTWGAGRAS